MNQIKITTGLFFLIFPFLTLSAQLTLVRNKKPVSRIICLDSSSVNKEAADLFNEFVFRISGTRLPILSETNLRKGDVVIGGKTDEAQEDGFLIECTDEGLRIVSGGDKGAIYGVVTILEKYMGVSYYAKESYSLTKSETIQLPKFRNVETPAFRYRQTFSYGNEDPVYVKWFRLEEPKDLFASNLWVHTFDRILPSDIYGKEHPEYYSFINGKRQPGNHSQWCLTNPEVFEVVAQKIDSIFKANPDARMISVSQNDGNDTYCSCENCKAVDDYEGAHSGTLVRFMNKLATRFPDKEFSTLAYLYSMQPPKHVKPLPNVNIMLCNIDCRREVPLTDNESGQNFLKAIEGWSAITNNIFIWDYGINFDNLVSPFPNFHILKKNIQLFKKHHATMLFEQVNGVEGADFSEMRAYMLSKLIWNPELDTDSLMRSFMNGYYGQAAPYLYQYRKIMEGALLASKTPLWIYDSPISHKDGMLNEYLLKTYNELFDQAEAAVEKDTKILKRVRAARLPLQYAELEIMRTTLKGDRDDLASKVELFRTRTMEAGVKALNERGNPPAEYCDLYLQRFLPGGQINKASKAKMIWTIPPADKYKKLAETALIDGLYGGSSYVEGWVGWVGTDADLIIDMGEEKVFSTVEADFLHQLGGWVLLPKSVTYSISSDNKTYSDFGTFTFAEDRDLAIKFAGAKVQSETSVKARYIRVFVDGLKLCPSWHYGVGHEAWFFMDEISVH